MFNQQNKSNQGYYKAAVQINNKNVDGNITVTNKILKSMTPPPHPHNYGGNGGNGGNGGKGGPASYSDFRNGNVSYYMSTEPTATDMIQLDCANINGSSYSIKDKIGNEYHTPVGVLKKRTIDGHTLFEVLRQQNERF